MKKTLWQDGEEVENADLDETLLLREASAFREVSTPTPEMCSGSEAGSYLRLIDFCITQI